MLPTFKLQAVKKKGKSHPQSEGTKDIHSSHLSRQKDRQTATTIKKTQSYTLLIPSIGLVLWVDTDSESRPVTATMDIKISVSTANPANSSFNAPRTKLRGKHSNTGVEKSVDIPSQLQERLFPFQERESPYLP